MTYFANTKKDFCLGELKTLKDMKKYVFSKGEVVGVEYLRAEAVKWVKHYRKINSKDKRISKKDVDVRGVQLGANYLIQEWIKHFFNLTEEDLR